MADTEITWRGLTLGGDSPYIVQSISGWDDLPDTNDLSQPRTRGDGDHVGDLFSQARIVTVNGKIADLADRDQLAQALKRVTTVRSDLYDLTIETLGQALTSQARVLRRALPVGEGYALGEVPFSLQFRCPDPLRYGPEQTTSTGLPAAGGGLAWPLFAGGVLDWGAAGTPGQVTLTNDGTDDVGFTFDVVAGTTYGLQQGWEVSAAGQRITYPTAVPAGQTITVDTAAGTVFAEGTADRRGELTNADWLLIPAADPDTGLPGQLTLQFTSLGGTYDPGSRLVPRWKAASE
jgi:hypothetical protein